MSMYTDPGHIHVNDPGKVEGNTVFQYLDVFGEDKRHIAELKERYQAGGLGDVTVKQYLFEVLDELLSPIRQRRRGETAETLLAWLLSLGCAREELCITATGYGRVSVPYADDTLTEITCHGRGACFLTTDRKSVV